MIRKSGYRFPTFAKPTCGEDQFKTASAGEGRSEKIMLQLGEFVRKAIGAVEIRLSWRMRQSPIRLVAVCLLDNRRQTEAATGAPWHICRAQSQGSPQGTAFG